MSLFNTNDPIFLFNILDINHNNKKVKLTSINPNNNVTNTILLTPFKLDIYRRNVFNPPK